ncbi:polyhydroxyalkanoic acid synthase subunit PhaR [Metabacillus iocasae]|uniref:Polyhydroxyalkanoic acid synthase PhaR subunit n=1 Tax=Priestia iocasae TaxID=2291674 RepID=A0ABS2QZ93_9BACI|nr:polyhydroxyalkanoic acid synthase PhaR subunit [Metabacillus iocasae]
MDQQKVFDPFLAWKEVYDKTESYWGKVIGENIQRDEFSQLLGNVLNMNLQYQQAVNEVTGRYFEQTNIPTKDDVANVASLVINVEEKIEGLEERFDDFETNQENNAAVRRELSKVKSDMKALDKKLDRVLAALEGQQQLQETLQEKLQEQLQQQSEKLQTQLLEQQMDLLDQSTAPQTEKSKQEVNK